MSAFFYGLALQWRLDIRSKSLLITCYVVPLLFFAIMGGIFTSINPEAKATLIQSMTVMGVTMGALIGLPALPGGGVRKRYQENVQSQWRAVISWAGINGYICVSPSFNDVCNHLRLSPLCL